LNTNQRPWWAFAMKMPLLDTVLLENHSATEKHFIVEGKPVLKSLHWVAYGPFFAVATIVGLGIMAWTMNVRAQSDGFKAMFAILFLFLPLIVWVAGSFIMGKATQKYLNRQISAEQVRVEIALNLSKQTLQVNQNTPIPFGSITAFKLISDSGTYFDPQSKTTSIYHLIAETTQGHVSILPKALGNIKQKLQLMSQLEGIIVPRS